MCEHRESKDPHAFANSFICHISKNTPVTPLPASIRKNNIAPPVHWRVRVVCPPLLALLSSGTFLLVRIAPYNFRASGLSTVNCERLTADVHPRGSPHGFS